MFYLQHLHYGGNVMKKIILATFASTLLLGLSVPPLETDAAAKKFKNCTELNKAYKGGIAKNSKVKNKGGKTKYKPTVFTSKQPREYFTTTSQYPQNI